MCKIGGYDKEEKAARAYDLAALKYWGPTTHINFPVFIISLSFCWETISCSLALFLHPLISMYYSVEHI